MRLICPNCDAQYEVKDDVIPMNGRDVQCSNCDTTWYQLHPKHLPKPEGLDETEDDVVFSDPGEGAASPVDPPRRKLDQAVADILREEAKLERRARAEAAGKPATQPDPSTETGGNEAKKRAPQSGERTVQILSKDANSKTRSGARPTSGEIASRRDLLPDIEEINSSLRSDGERRNTTRVIDDPIMDDSDEESAGFRRGFILMILVTLMLIMVYGYAPQIARAVPQTDPYLSGFVAQVDTVRFWLDGRVSSFLTWLDTIAASQNG